jgi:hypothetical protein
MLAVLAAPASSHADGLPVLGIAPTNTSVGSAVGGFTYTARFSRSQTRLSRLSSTGRVIRAARLAGEFAVPRVAYDGSPSGLSGDGRTLVLIRPRTRFPQRRTTLAVIDPGTLTIRRLIGLHGDFSFDAIAPDGRWLYLIQYTSRVDPTRYRVRALDVRSGRLLPGDIVDPHDRGEAMRGNPMTRVSSADGRWAYTLYDGNGRPFVHALDTAGRTARCIDLPVFLDANPWDARLRLIPGDDRLLVTFRRRVLATIDTRTLAVIRPAGARPPARASTNPAGRLGGLAAIALVLATAAYGARRSIVQRVPARRSYRSRS